MWIVLALSAAMLILLINGLIQQERVRLWQRHQETLVAKRRVEMEEQRKVAAQKIKEMLRERRSGLGLDGEGQPASEDPESDAPGTSGEAPSAETPRREPATRKPARTSPEAAAN